MNDGELILNTRYITFIFYDYIIIISVKDKELDSISRICYRAYQIEEYTSLSLSPFSFAQTLNRYSIIELEREKISLIFSSDQHITV